MNVLNKTFELKTINKVEQTIEKKKTKKKEMIKTFINKMWNFSRQLNKADKK